LNKALPNIIEYIKGKGSNDLRIWCAGCAAGEEAYTLSMIINEFLGYKINQWDVGILASDISISSLEKAQNGIYTIDKILNLPESYIKRYFTEQDDGYKVVNELRNIILFKRLNLMNEFSI
jgi:chemotaxis protein methyltransferase CheR